MNARKITALAAACVLALLTGWACEQLEPERAIRKKEDMGRTGRAGNMDAAELAEAISLADPGDSAEIDDKNWIVPREIRLHDISYKDLAASLILKHESPVSARDLKTKMSLEMNGKPAEFELEAVEDDVKSTKVSFKLPRVEKRNMVRLGFLVGEGDSVRGASDSAVRSIHDIAVGKAPEIRITSVNIEEGANGHFLRVYCDDYSERYYWNKCEMPIEQLENSVSITPGVNPTIVPEKRGFRVFGDFKAGDYKLTVGERITSVSGGILFDEYKSNITVPHRAPRAEFAAKGRYLPRKQVNAVPVKHMNLDKVEVTLRQVPEQNLVFWLSGDYEQADSRTSDFVASRVFTLVSEQDKEGTTWLDLSAMLPPDARGLFEFNLKGGNEDDALRVILTDLAVVSKSHGVAGQDLSVWVMEAESLAPAAGAIVEVYTKSNIKMASAATDAIGGAQFKNLFDPSLEADKRLEPFALVIRRGGQVTALRFTDVLVPLTEFAVQGEAYNDERAYRASIYADRGVYRPGESAHLAAIVWEKGEKAPASQVPVIGKLIDPRGKLVKRTIERTNASGMFALDLDFQDYAATGKYLFRLEIGNNEIASREFHVEEYVPERMKVSARPAADGALLSEPAAFRVKARYLFGADAANEKMEAACTLDEKDLSFEQHPGYTFNVWRPEPVNPIPLGVVNETLNDKGEAVFECPSADKVTSLAGPGEVSVIASVFEAGSGRSTIGRSSMPLHPDRHYFGLKANTEKAIAGQEVTVSGVVVDWQGNKVPADYQAEIGLIELQAEWVYEYDPDEGYTRWRRFIREIPIENTAVSTEGGEFTHRFKPSRDAMGFVVRATGGADMRTDLYIEGTGYSYWWYGHSSRGGETPGPSSPEGLAIEAEGLARVGEPLPVKIKAPYAGRLLLTVETDRVMDARWLDVKEGEFTADVVVSSFVPNAYIGALLIKDPFFESEGAFSPGRSFGVTSVKVNPESRQLNVAVIAPDEVMPNTRLDVGLAVTGAEGPIFATVAAVDEGILQLTGFESPDPLADIFKKRALAVATHETIGWTLMLPPPPEAKSTGGGGGYEEPSAEMSSGRIQPIESVALWSGLVEVGPDGKARVSFDVPTYRGELRVMAVAASPGKIGSADKSVTVKDPLVLQPTFPRFLLKDDLAVVPVSLTNTTDLAEKVNVELKTSESVKIIGAPVKSVSLEPGENAVLTFLARAEQASGAAEFSIEANGDKNVSRDSATVPLIPNAPLTRETSLAKLDPGSNDLSGIMDGWDPRFESTTVTVTPNVYLRELGHLSYLVRYPYGCIEQTTSTTRPLLFINNLVPEIDPELVKNAGVEEMVQHGIDRILGMQTPEGGFSYWPGGAEPCYWGTAYATHVLLEAREAGYPVDKDRLGEALSFMENTLNRTAATTDRRHDYAGMVDTEPYMHFVLAKAGRGRPKRIARLVANPDANWGDLAEENEFLLKAALYLSGDRTYEADLKNVPVAISDKRRNGWTFWSALRTRGIMLDVLEDLFPGAPETEPLARSIASAIGEQGSRYYTTQDLAWCVGGLGKRAAGGASEWSRPILTLAGTELEPLPPRGEKDASNVWTVDGASRPGGLELAVDEIEGGNLYAFVRVEGIKPGVDFEEGDHYIKATRTYMDAAGNKIDPSNIQLGQLVYVALTLKNETKEEIKNVAMVDRFAGGFDVENPRLNRDQAQSMADPNTDWATTYMNIRDDRVELFGHLGPGQEVTSVYAMRAVVAGRYDTPPLRAEAMYDPRVFSQHKGAKITVHDPWDALTD